MLFSFRQVLGEVETYFYTIEFQKRGLPHVHLLLIMKAACKFRNTDDIDRVVSAELPNAETQTLLHAKVAKHMVHGPCGHLNPAAPCMKDGVCTKGFPKAFSDYTSIPEDGFPIYKVIEGGPLP